MAGQPIRTERVIDLKLTGQQAPEWQDFDNYHRPYGALGSLRRATAEDHGPRRKRSTSVGRERLIERLIESVQTFCTSSWRPAGPLAPPTRRTASAPAAAATNAGRAGAKSRKRGAAMTYSRHRVAGGAVACSRCWNCPGRARTRQERLRRRLRRSSTLDRTSPKVPEFAAIGSRGKSGHGG
jgi:hypothetical protein